MIIKLKKSRKIREPVPIIHAPSVFFRIDLMTIKNDDTTALIMKPISKYSEKLSLKKISEMTEAIKSTVENQKYFLIGLLKSE